jgi:hypothetical protein
MICPFRIALYCDPRSLHLFTIASFANTSAKEESPMTPIKIRSIRIALLAAALLLLASVASAEEAGAAITAPAASASPASASTTVRGSSVLFDAETASEGKTSEDACACLTEITDQTDPADLQQCINACIQKTGAPDESREDWCQARCLGHQSQHKCPAVGCTPGYVCGPAHCGLHQCIKACGTPGF